MTDRPQARLTTLAWKEADHISMLQILPMLLEFIPPLVAALISCDQLSLNSLVEVLGFISVLLANDAFTVPFNLISYATQGSKRITGKQQQQR